MTLPHRIALYRRVIGFLRYCDYQPSSLSARMRDELQVNLHLATLITGDLKLDVNWQLHLLRVLLADALLKHQLRYQLKP